MMKEETKSTNRGALVHWSMAYLNEWAEPLPLRTRTHKASSSGLLHSRVEMVSAK